MRALILVLLLLSMGGLRAARATTWDEPWHEQVVKGADSFMLARVVASNEKKGVTIKILQTLAGTAVTGTVKITGFYGLDLCSSSGGHGPEFHFSRIDSCYFFLKKIAGNRYSMATPTAGYAVVRGGEVAATYRHSYHQALVPPATYEPTMTAIFQHYHQLPVADALVRRLVAEALALPPAALGEEGMPVFFRQHVALECIYHLGLADQTATVLPFVRDTANRHAQISGVRALRASDTPAARQQLVQLLRDTTTVDFVQVLAVRTLAAYRPRELKATLNELVPAASTRGVGFGGNIMDPRVCTSLPSVQEALTKLVAEL